MSSGFDEGLFLISLPPPPPLPLLLPLSFSPAATQSIPHSHKYKPLSCRGVLARSLLHIYIPIYILEFFGRVLLSSTGWVLVGKADNGAQRRSLESAPERSSRASPRPLSTNLRRKLPPSSCVFITVCVFITAVPITKLFAGVLLSVQLYFFLKKKKSFFKGP